MEGLSLVTGANGHFGNNLVRCLISKGFHVRAAVRNVKDTQPFEGIDCEIVHADLLETDSLNKALKGVDTLYQAAAVYRHWAPNVEKQIVNPNIDGTVNILHAAASQGVKKIVYVSSIGALDHRCEEMDEHSWNHDFSNPYYKSKVLSEQRAREIAQKHNMNMVTVLPSAMIGPNSFRRLTPTMEILKKMLQNRIPFDPNLFLHWVDVRDVAEGAVTAARKGRVGERYILGTEEPVGTSEIFGLAKSVIPEVRIPSVAPKWMLKLIAGLMETSGRFTGKEPGILRCNIDTYYNKKSRLNIGKARADLNFDPVEPRRALKEALVYLAGSCLKTFDGE